MIGLMKMETGRLKGSLAEVDFSDYYNGTGAPPHGLLLGLHFRFAPPG